MSLHGDVRVNDELLGTWVARRVAPLEGAIDPDTECSYECTWAERDGGAAQLPELKHRHGDGALVLAQEVLVWVSQHAAPQLARRRETS